MQQQHLNQKIVAALVAARRAYLNRSRRRRYNGNNLTSPIYSGKAMQTVSVSGDVAISIRANVFASASTAADVSVVDQSGDVATAVQDVIARASSRLDVS